MIAESTKRLVETLALSAPWALLSRFEDLSRCIEASVCGAEVLGKHGLHARVFPCSLIAVRNGTAGVMLGFSREEQAKIHQGEKHYIGTASPDKDGFHCAIEVEEQLIVDLTLGQLWAAGVDVPSTFVSNRADFENKQFRTPNDWSFFYERVKRTPPELEEYKACDHSGLTEDFEALVKLALHVGRDVGPDDRRRTNAHLVDVLSRTIDPDVFLTTSRRLLALRERAKKIP